MLKAFRDHGPRADRQQARLIWLVEALGMDAWVRLVESYMGEGVRLRPAVHPTYDAPWPRRDVLGVHAQKQEGHMWVGACVPAGRLHAADFDDLARIAEVRACIANAPRCLWAVGWLGMLDPRKSRTSSFLQ